MKPHPEFEQVMEQLLNMKGLDRLKELLVWYTASENAAPVRSQRFDAILDAAEKTDVETCYNLLHALDDEDKVIFSILNEFGPSITQRPFFSNLVEGVLKRLQGA